MADPNSIDPNLIAALLARARTSPEGLTNELTATGPDTGAAVRSYEPGLKDLLARLVLGDRPDEARMAVSDAVLGTRGFGPTSNLPLGMSTSSLTPIAPAIDFVDKSAAGNIPGAVGSGVQAALAAPGIGGRLINEVGDIAGPAVDAGRRGLTTAAETIAARPLTSTAAGATGAIVGASPEAGEARVDHPDRPKPPASPPPLPSYDDFLASRHAAEAARLGAAYGAKSKARTEQEAKKAYGEIETKRAAQVKEYDKARDEWAARAAQFDKDQAERERQANYSQPFAERHPLANYGLMGLGYLAPFSIARRGANVTNEARQGLVDKFARARAAEDPAKMAEAALAAYRFERAPLSTVDKLKTVASVGGPAETQSLGRIIDMASADKDTETYKKAQGDFSSAEYWLKLIPQLMAGGFAYSMGAKLPSPVPGALDLKKYDAPTYGLMQKDFVPRATEPTPGTFGMMSRPVDPTAERTTAHIAQILRAMADQRMRAEATAAEADRVTRGIRNATNGTNFDNLRRRKPINED